MSKKDLLAIGKPGDPLPYIIEIEDLGKCLWFHGNEQYDVWATRYIVATRKGTKVFNIAIDCKLLAAHLSPVKFRAERDRMLATAHMRHFIQEDKE